ncbi:translation elongation factor EF-Ts [Peptoniphilus olsenii]|uniref:Translation elongation factor EF-Ts n=1 Tax=Peptoniphilus olsenii TaxID=411570 RepID=A0ABV2J7A3_9FIRM
MISMEKIDYVINLTGASYDIVRKALLDVDGDVDLAIKIIEEDLNSSDTETIEAEVIEEEGQQNSHRKQSKEYFDEFSNAMDEIIEAIKEIWRKGNARRLLVEKDNETVLSLSLATSAIGLALALPASLLGLSAAYIYDYSFKIIMENGEVIDIKEYLKDKNKFFKK